MSMNIKAVHGTKQSDEGKINDAISDLDMLNCTIITKYVNRMNLSHFNSPRG